jgi:hypothetical protein
MCVVVSTPFSVLAHKPPQKIIFPSEDHQTPSSRQRHCPEHFLTESASGLAKHTLQPILSSFSLPFLAIPFHGRFLPFRRLCVSRIALLQQSRSEQIPAPADRVTLNHASFFFRPVRDCACPTNHFSPNHPLESLASGQQPSRMVLAGRSWLLLGL